MGREWSNFQNEIFSFVRKERGSCLINAVAGSGKTTSIEHAATLIPRNHKTIFLAFNNSIVKELESRLPQHIRCRTTHSLGYRMWRMHNPRVQGVNDERVGEIVRRLVESRKSLFTAKTLLPPIMYATTKLVQHMKTYGVFPPGYGRPESPEWTDLSYWVELIYRERLDERLAEKDFEIIFQIARDALLESIATAHDEVDFADMIYMPVLMNLKGERFDAIFIDEVQDLSLLQHKLLDQLRYPTTRILGVGDPAQAIYGWRGALNDSMMVLRKSLGATELPLSICYRCGSDIVKMAQEIVPHIEAAPNASRGQVKFCSEDYSNVSFQPNDLVICRSNAPLVRFAYSMVKERIPVKIQGKDIGESLARFIDRFRAHSIRELLESVDLYHNTRQSQLLEKGLPSDSLLKEQREVVYLLAEFPEVKEPRDLGPLVRTLFTDVKEGEFIKASSVHRAKGGEAHRVYVLEAQQLDRPEPQMENLKYVAITRAKQELYWLDADQGSEISKPPEQNFVSVEARTTVYV
jgi:superfamily I DNA/RNA helicase